MNLVGESQGYDRLVKPQVDVSYINPQKNHNVPNGFVSLIAMFLI